MTVVICTTKFPFFTPSPRLQVPQFPVQSWTVSKLRMRDVHYMVHWKQGWHCSQSSGLPSMCACLDSLALRGIWNQLFLFLAHFFFVCEILPRKLVFFLAVPIWWNSGQQELLWGDNPLFKPRSPSACSNPSIFELWFASLEHFEQSENCPTRPKQCLSFLAKVSV